MERKLEGKESGRELAKLEGIIDISVDHQNSLNCSVLGRANISYS